MIEPRIVHAVETADYWYNKVVRNYKLLQVLPYSEESSVCVDNYDFYFCRAYAICEEYGYEVVGQRTGFAPDDYHLTIRRVRNTT